MGLQRVNALSFGGINDSANIANYPIDRLVRCTNWVPQPNGNLRLRYGYSQPTMSSVQGSDIDSATYYEKFDGSQFVIYSQGTALKQFSLSTGVVTSIGTLSNGNNWGHFRANNKIHISNGTDFLSWDGATLRPNGIRPASTTEVAGISFTTATGGSLSTTITDLTGIDAYIAYYNPNTGHVGNRTKISKSRIQVLTTNQEFILTGLPNLSSVNSEWVKIIGFTPDGTDVPYWPLDTNGNRIIVGNTASTATFTSYTLDFNAELPTRNTVGAGFSGFAKVGTRIFGIKPNDNFVYYSQAEEDAVSGIFIGRPEESWPGNNAEAYPTSEVPTCVGSYNFEAWIFSRNYLMRWSETLRQQVTDPWIGPYQVGCAGQRAFVVTPYGPFWITPDRELFTWQNNAPIDAGNDYTRTILGSVNIANIAAIEMTYHRDIAKRIDCIKILANDQQGNPFIIVHDFMLRDDRSPFGQAYLATYVGSQPSTFVGSGYTPLVPVRDFVEKRLRCWTGDSSGRFNQIDFGFTDNGATYNADAISGPIALGPTDKQVPEIEILGDQNIAISYSNALIDSDSDFIPLEREDWLEDNAIANYKVTDHGRYIRFRFQMTSDINGQFSDGGTTYATPFNDYGTMYQFVLKLGAERAYSR